MSLDSCISGEEQKRSSKFVESKSSQLTEEDLPPSQTATVSDTTSETSVCSEVTDMDNVAQHDTLDMQESSCVPPVVEASQDESFLTESSMSSSDVVDDLDNEDKPDKQSFFLFRMSYLLVTLVIMLADGLQGTHLYVLYEGYGFSVASLYCLGFLTGAVTAPITGPLIDKLGRKKAALLYCALEVGINMLEQFPFLSGLIVSRMVGGVTTNLLSTVFEAWVDTEYRARGFSEEDYETLMRDSIVVSNLAAIASGYLAHVLAEALGPVGPFEGAVTCTAIAFAVVFFLWTENYGSLGKEDGTNKSSIVELKETFQSIRADSRILRVCITQGLTMGSLHIFIFLWSPVLKDFSDSVNSSVFGLDGHGEPAYGLIFGAFMATGVIGGLSSPFVRKMVTLALSPLTKSSVPEVVSVEGEGLVRPMTVEFQGALCYFLCALLLSVPCFLSATDASSFTIALGCFLVYEFIVGVYFPCEGVIRSLYMPPDTRGSMMTIPRIIVNLAVSLGVISTEFVSHQTALGIISMLMLTSGVLQLSLVSKREWQSLFGRMERVRRRSMRPIRSLSSSVLDLVHISPKSSSSSSQLPRRCVSCIEGKVAANDLVAAFPELQELKPKAD